MGPAIGGKRAMPYPQKNTGGALMHLHPPPNFRENLLCTQLMYKYSDFLRKTSGMHA